MAATPTRVGLFGIGLDTYWPQFEGLLGRLAGYQGQIAGRLRGFGVELVDAGMVDNPDKARAAASLFRREEVELIFLYVSTYALSSTVLPVVQKARVPVIVLNLQPVAQLDYARFNALGDRGMMTGVWLEHCQSCSAPEIACVFNRAGIAYPSRHRLSAGRGRLAGNSGLGGRRAGDGRHAREPRGRAGPLLLRDARRLQRPDPAVGRHSAIISNCWKCARCTSFAKP